MSKLIGADTNKDDIIAYLRDPEDDDTRLSPKQKDLLTWYVDAYTFVRNYSSIPDAIQFMIKLGKSRNQPISASTARRYINDALEIFGKVNKLKAEVIKDLVVETLIDARNMAKALNNPMAMIQAAKELNNVAGVEDASALHADDIQRHIVKIEIDQTAKRALKAIYKGGVVDLDRVLEDQTEDISYEEVDDE